MNLEVKNCSLSINSVQILKNISLHLNNNELIGLIGPNGAGKSSLIKIIARLIEQTSGEVLLDGNNIDQVSRNQRAKNISYLPQNCRAVWPLTVEKIVSLGRLPYQGWLQKPSKEDLAAVANALEITETTAYKNRTITSLSGGEQTLAMLARIFATEPEIILADEPIAALDPYHQLHVMELLRKHAEHQGSGIVVLHDLTMAAKFCDRLYMIAHGELIATGPPAEVLTEKNIEHVYGVSSQISCDENGVSISLQKRESDYHP